MRVLLWLAALTLMAGCTSMNPTPPTPKVAPVLTSEDARDPWSFAQPEVARVTHVSLDLALDFAAHRVSGTATLDVLAAPEADTLVLDDNGLKIAAITDAGGRALPFAVGERVEGKGSPLTVTIGTARKIVVTYSATNPAALQWLAPEQTAGGKHPYLFSQGQAILNRSWIPTQDSPGIRQTWDARIVAPKPLTVVMSGLAQDHPDETGDGRRVFRFTMDKPVAPYLIAIAAGDLVFRELGPRSGVWSEPATITAAAAELSDTEAMIETSEKLYGPYRWGRYDMIVLPPSFPYGGMENPTLTFLTPTFIAGDKSLNTIVAHELAHSWSGNLVTNANWADSWINEGVTSYFEIRVVEAIYGRRRADQEAALQFAEVEKALAGKAADDFTTALHLPPALARPEGSASGIVYDKGALFMRTVEQIAGRARFDAWLRQWFDAHAFQPATSAMILADMRKNLVRGDAGLERKLMLEEWIYRPGLPVNAVRPDPAVFAAPDAAAALFATTGRIDRAQWDQWSTAERLRFMDRLPRAQEAPALARLDADLGLSRSGNDEILFAWLNLALANRYEPAVPVAEAFLVRVGRGKFVRPLFQTLVNQHEWGRSIAERIYAKTRASYHSVTQGGVDRILKPSP